MCWNNAWIIPLFLKCRLVQQRSRKKETEELRQEDWSLLKKTAPESELKRAKDFSEMRILEKFSPWWMRQPRVSWQPGGPTPPSQWAHWVLFDCVFRVKVYYIAWLAWNLPYRLSWLWIHRDLSALASPVLGLEACGTTTSPSKIFFLSLLLVIFLTWEFICPIFVMCLSEM